MTAAPAPSAPIILTALMGAEDFAWANALRRSHFPPGRNIVPAHISLFHHLPPSGADALVRMMRALCNGPAPAARISGVQKLGRGVAFSVHSPDLLALWGQVADAFHHHLIPQDQHPPRLHITIQNKADVADARALYAQMAAQFRARPLAITGLAAWWYRAGPWELLHQQKFRHQPG
ncbi:MAG: 2'-5' RNA ligase family protein [Sphingopyxis sp.]